ncbi:MAG: helix-hairpin-helix domain-containing protein [Cyclobacteriaceae bacterium]|nr:helix-hairpin-helix domain-containing protein [Cyclobacteriaceae bacterium]
MNSNRLLKSLRNYFGYSRGEIRSVMILLPLFISIPFFKNLTINYTSELPKNKVNSPISLDSIILLIKQPNVNNNSTDSIVQRIKKEENKINTPQYFPFDPNYLREDSFLLMGIPKYAVQNLVKYRKKGGVFSSKNDILKIYGLTKSTFQKIEPFITFKPPTSISPQLAKQITAPVSNLNKTKIDLNNADSLQLKDVFGVGTILSRRIIKYRDALGGFIEMEQLYEIYKLDSEVVYRIKEKFYIEKEFKPRTLEVLSLTEKELSKHPYLNYKEALLLARFAEQHPDFKSLEDFIKISGFDSTKIKKIRPYLSFGK